jgi:hypothetical protein
MSIDRSIAQHYAHGDLERAILDALIARARTRPLTIEDLAPADSSIWRPGRDGGVLREARPETGMHVLDIGSGLGGPARFAAQALGCR